MAGSTACQHEWLASRKRPTWDYCPKCGATRNRQLLEQGAAETDAAQPVTVEPVAVMVEPVAEAPEHPLDDADRAIEPAVVAPPPTSMADASVTTLGRGAHTPLSMKSGTVRLALCASTISAIGNPISRAQIQATALPRLPLGTMNEAGPSVRRATSRLAAA